MRKLLGIVLFIVSGLLLLYELIMGFWAMTGISFSLLFDFRNYNIIKTLFGFLSVFLLPIAPVTRAILALYLYGNPKPLLLTTLGVVLLIVADKLLTVSYTIQKPKELSTSEANLPKLRLYDQIKIRASVPLIYFMIVFGTSLTLGLGVGMMLFLFDQMVRSTGSINITIFILLGMGTFLGVTTSLGSLKNSLTRQFQFLIGIPVTSTTSSIYKAVKEVADKLHTTMPKHILIVIDDDFHVQNAHIKLSTGTIINGNTLVIGFPFIKYLTAEEIKAIIAHELAHFTGNDTVVSTKVAPGYRALRSWFMNTQGLSSIGGAQGVWVALPNYFSSFLAQKLFLWFEKNLARVDRVREARADIIGAVTYGSNTFENALKKVIQVGTVFSEAARKEIFDFAKGHSPIYPTFYQYFDAFYMKNKNIDERFAEIIKNNAITSEFDTHYSYAERVAYLPEQTAQPHKKESKIVTQKEEQDYEKHLYEIYVAFVKKVTKR